MPKPINLRQARKRKARDDKAKQGDANRVAYGTPKAQREQAQLEKARRLAALEGHLRQREPSPDTDEA